MNQSLCVEMSEKRSKMQRLENKCNRLFERLKKQESLYYCVKRSWTLVYIYIVKNVLAVMGLVVERFAAGG